MNNIKISCQKIVQKSKLFERLSIGVIFLDAILIFLETFSSMQVYIKHLTLGLWIITAFFAVEYAIRILGAKDPKKYAMSFLGIVDFLAVASTLVLAGTGVHTGYVRVVRVFRFVKLTRYMKSYRAIETALANLKSELIGFFVFLIVLLMSTSILIYQIEHKAQPENISNAFDALYMSVITFTTLGYGDITPVTALGKFFIFSFALLSILLLAIPSALFISEYINVKKKLRYEEQHSTSRDRKEYL